jgi:WbqC-like protein
MIVAINQPCYLPWRGFFALMKAADIFVFYDNVQFTTTRSFFARVQLKTAAGRRWLTVPVHKSGRFGQRIDETEILDNGWPARHCAAMRSAFEGAPFGATVEPLLATLTGRPWERLADLTVTTTIQMAELLGLTPRTLRASAIGIGGSGTERLLAICRSLGATRYVTGHGALDYLEHEAFDAAGIAVEYMDYDLSPYAQLHGAFEPYVTALDALANIGPDALAHVNAATVPWREMVARRAAAGVARR